MMEAMETITESKTMWESLPYSEKTCSALRMATVAGSVGVGVCTSLYTVDTLFKVNRPHGILDCVGVIGVTSVVSMAAMLAAHMAISAGVEVAGDRKWHKELKKGEEDAKKRHYEYPQPNMALYPKFGKDEDGIVVDGDAPEAAEEETDGEGGNA